MICLVGCASEVSVKPVWVNRTNNRAVVDYESGLDGQLSSLAGQVALQLSAGSRKSIILKGFTNERGKKSRLENYLEVEIANRLIKTGVFNVFSFDELGDEAVTKEEATRNLNRIIMYGAPAYLVGTTIKLPESVKINIKLVCVKTGRVIGTASVQVHRDRTVESLLAQYGVIAHETHLSRDFNTGQVIKASDNQYIDLIPWEYTLYVKQVNFEYSLFTNRESYAEVFLNDEYRVMKVDDMIALTFDKERYVLALRNISDHIATFTFAHLTPGAIPATENFSLANRDPFNEPASVMSKSSIVEEDLAGDSEEVKSASTTAPKKKPGTAAATTNQKKDNETETVQPDATDNDTKTDENTAASRLAANGSQDARQ